MSAASLDDAALLDYIERTPGLKRLLNELFPEGWRMGPELLPDPRYTVESFHANEQRIRSECVPQGEPVAWMLKTGHGTKVVEVKPPCEVDYWKPLYAAPQSAVPQESELVPVRKDVVDFLTGSAALDGVCLGANCQKESRAIGGEAICAPPPRSPQQLLLGAW